MNIILKGFDGEPIMPVIEQALRDIPIETCISICNRKECIPSLNTQNHHWYDASLLRAGKYPDVDWADIISLDEDLIEKMQPCESVFMTMISRYAQPNDLSYKERTRQYIAHLRYWNHVLETQKIDVFFANNMPHQCYDWVIYCLCKEKGISTFYLDRFAVLDRVFLTKDWENPGEDLQKYFSHLKNTHKESEEDISMPKMYEDYLQAPLKQENTKTLWYTSWDLDRQQKQLHRKSFFIKWSGVAITLLWKAPGNFIKAIFSPAFWERKWGQHKTFHMYDQNTQEPDLSKPYIYYPLHYEPEAMLCPLSGAFADQTLSAQLLAWHLPKNVSIYVKEHPRQGELHRSRSFYQAFLDIPSVKLVPRDYDTFTLIRNAKAIATGVGTAGLEGLFCKKPVLMFGHFFYQYISGVYPIRTHDDCREAIHEIFQEGKQPSLSEVRCFLKAVAESGETYLGPQTHTDNLSKEERTKKMGNYIANYIHQNIPL